MRSYHFMLLLLLSSPSATVYAQCPDLAGRYVQFNELASSDSLLLLHGKSLLQQWETCGAASDSVYAKLMHTLGRCYWRRRDLVEAERCTRLALTINSRTSRFCRPQNRANSYTNLGQILELRGQYRPAIEAYDRAIAIAFLNPAKYTVGAIAAEKRAITLNFLGDYEQAAESAQVGYWFARQANDLLRSVQNRVQEIQARTRLKQLQRVEELVGETLPLAKSLNSPTDLANVFSLAASVSGEQHRPAIAINYYEQAFLLNKEAKNTYGCWQTLINEAYAYQQDKQQQKALQTFTWAEAYAVTPIEKALLKAYRSESVVQQGKPALALALLRQALSEFGIHYPSTRPDSVSIRATDKKEYLLTVLRMEADVLRTLGQQTGRFDYRTEARRTYRLADFVIDLMRWEHRGQQSKLYWRETTHSLYEHAIDVCAALRDKAGAYYFIEKSRSVLLTDKLNELGARQYLPPTFALSEQRLSEMVATQRAKLQAEPPGTARYRTIQNELIASQEQYDGYVRELEATHPLYYRYKYDNRVPSLSAIKSWVAGRTTSLITYFVGDSSLFIVGIRPSGEVRLIRQSASVFNHAARSWLTVVSDPVTLNNQPVFNEFIRQGAFLYNLLLRPLHLPPGRVVISPDGFFLPFDALSHSATSPQYAVQTYAFSYAYALSHLIRDTDGGSADRVTTDGSFLGMAPVRFQGNATERQTELRGSDIALERIGSRFFRPTLLTGPVATKAQFRKRAPQSSIVHLFTHADADTLNREPVLYFADSTLLLSELMTGSAFQTELLVLSACKTGVGANQKGEGVFSLARGFSALGVPSILTALWSVETRPTYDLTDLFYKFLADGLSRDLALQRAKQQWLRTANRANQLPSRWAGLILVGESQPLHGSLLASLKKQLPLLFGVGGCLVLLSIWLVRRRRLRLAQSGSRKPSLN